jgi:hypothetical protein
MQMIDVLKRLAELDAQNPNIVQEKRVDESLDECGMMGGMGMSHPHSPASINMTAATGEELSGMLRDIMQLAGRPMQEPTGGEEPMGDMEPMGGADGVAVVDVEPSPEVGSDEPSIMRSMIDKLNPDDEMGDDDEEEKTDEMYDNSPDEQIAGYDAAVPSGNDLHKQKQQFPATQLGDNPMAATYEGLMAEYKKFISEDDNYTKAAVNHANRMGQMQPDKKADWDDEAAFLKTADAQEEIGQQMANDGITYSPEKEKEIIGLMAQYMKKAGMSPKQIRYLLNYNEDYISDQLSFLPRQGEADTMESMLKLAGLKK